MRIIEDMAVPHGPSPRRSSKHLTALGIGVALATLMFGAAALFQARCDTWNQAQQGASNLLIALDRDIARNIMILDLSLQRVAEALADPGLNQATPSIRHHALFDSSSNAEDLGSLLVLDTDGDVVEDSTSLIPHKLALGDRDYFQVHRDRPSAGLFISRPFQSRLSGGDLRVAISRRLNTADGRFAGVVEGALRLAYFRRLFEQLDLGAKGSIALFRADGRILIRYPFSEADIDRDMSRGESFRHMAQAKSGQYVTRASIDGVERLFTFRQIGDLPLILAVNLATDDIYAPWWRKALVIGPALGLLCAGAVASCLLFRREVIRRSEAETAVAEAAEKLSVIAATDGLTELLNRRGFEAEFDRAFRRAIRTGTSLALIIIDADFFKLFNDGYGHPAGDVVLRAIADRMAEHVRRPDDLTARYGGEEFVALLPDTERIAASVIADRIRAAIADLAIPHAGSPAGHVTVSAGVTSMAPFVGDDPSLLIKTADEALYMAKRDGRNCVRFKEISYMPLLPHYLAPKLVGAAHTAS